MGQNRIVRLAGWLPLFSFLAILAIGAIAVRQQGPLQEHLRRAVSWELSRSLGRKVSLQGIRLSFLLPGKGKSLFSKPRLGVNLRNLSVEQPGEKEKDFLRVPEVSLEFQPDQFLTGKAIFAALEKVSIVRPQLYLARDEQGVWNFADLLALKVARPPRFRGKIEVVEGRLVFFDFSPPEGLPAPQENHLENLYCSIFAPRPNKFQFRLWGLSREKRVGHFFALGHSDYSGRLSASVSVSAVDLGYLWHYQSLVPQIEIGGGRADVSGYFLVRRREDGPALLDYALTIAGKQAELSLPWVQGKLQEVGGLVRASNGLVQLCGLEGRLGQARVEGDGYLLASSANRLRQADFSQRQQAEDATPPENPPNRGGYAFRFRAENAGGREIARLLHGDLPVAAERLEGQGTFSVGVVGRGSESAIFGSISSQHMGIRQTVPRGEAARALERPPSEVREVQAGFIYSHGSFGATGRAALLGGQVRGAFSLPASGKGRFSASLAGAHLPASALPRGSIAIQGKAFANLWGEFPVLPTARSDRSVVPFLEGQFALVNGEAHPMTSGKRLVRFPFHRIAADFSYAKGELSFPQAGVWTDYGAFDFSGRLSPGGGVKARLQGRGIDLERIQDALGIRSSGLAFISARLSGSVSQPEMELRGDIFEGGYAGYEWDWLGGEVLLRRREIPHFSIVFQRGSGEGRFTGQASLPAGADPGKIWAQGKIEKAQLGEWLPAGALRQRAKGVFDCDVTVRGSPRSPQMEANFQIARPWAAGMQFDLAEGALRYEKGELLLPSFVARVDRSQLTASGVMRAGGVLDFDFSAERLRLASLLRTLSSWPEVEGLLSLHGRLQGKRVSPQASLSLRAEELAFAGHRAGQLQARLLWNGKGLEIADLDFAAQGGHLRLSGELLREKEPVPGKRTAASRPPNPESQIRNPTSLPWKLRLKTDLEGMPAGLLIDLLESGLEAGRPGEADRLLRTLGKIPRPLRGFLTASASIAGAVASPTGEAEFAFSEGSLGGQHLPSIEGKVGFGSDRLSIHSLVAKEGDAFATASGEVEFASETNLNVDIHNLGAEVLRPWVKGISGLGGSADIYLRITGPTSTPNIRGDLEIADPVFGNIRLERVKIDRFLLARERLDIEDLRLVKGPHRIRISASLPYSWRLAQLKEEGPLQAKAILEGQDLSFLSSLWPRLGGFAGPLDMKLEIGGTPAKPRLEAGFIHADGKWQKDGLDTQAKISLQCRVVDHSLLLRNTGGGPGLVIQLQRNLKGRVLSRGSVEASGDYDPFAGPRSGWGRGRCDIALTARELEGQIGEMLSGRVNADLIFRRVPAAPAAEKISGEVEISRARVSPPSRRLGEEISWRPRFSPQLEVKVRVREAQVFSPAARVDLSGQGKITGRLGYEPLGLAMRLTSQRGALDFPAAVAHVEKMEVVISKEPEEPLRALGHVEAKARVGRYRIDLSGGGPLFPVSDLRIRASASPPLSEAESTALLLGVPPAALGAGELAAEEALGQQVAQRLSSSVTALAATGVSAPLLRAVGLSELSFAISPIASRLQVGKRLGERLYVYYLSSLGGAVRSTLFRLILDITPRLSAGFSVNEQQQWRYEIQTTRGF